MIKGFEVEMAFRIQKERESNGEYQNFEDFFERVAIGLEQLEVLIRVNAFRFGGIDKRKLLWKACYHCQASKVILDEQPLLFGRQITPVDLPDFSITSLENAFDEIELLGFPLCSPFHLLKDQLPSHTVAGEMIELVNRRVLMIGYLITLKRTRTHNGNQMYFGTFIDREGAWIDTVHFPPVVRSSPFRGPGIYTVRGKIIEEFGFYTIEVSSMERLAYVEDPRYAVG